MIEHFEGQLFRELLLPRSFLEVLYLFYMSGTSFESRYHIYSTTKEAWAGMKHAIFRATRSIYWEVYTFVDDDVGSEFFDVLVQKAKQGVDVKLIVDWWGSFSLSKKRIQSLRMAGIDIQLFHARKHKYRGLWKMLMSRTHRKILVIDETVGFIGGVNVQKSMEDWLDIHLRLEGSVVRSLLRAFAKSYLISGGKRHCVSKLLKGSVPLFSQDSLFEFVFDDAHKKRSTARAMYLSAVNKAKTHVTFFTPYYFPDKAFVRSLWNARRRGIRIDLLVPFRSDVRFASYAAYAWYTVLHAFGVQIHFVKQMMHGKGVIVDDEWAMVGSSNLNQESFYDHYEANVAFRDKHLVKSLSTIITSWRNTSDSFADIAKKPRRWTRRLKEWICLRLYCIWRRQDNIDI